MWSLRACSVLVLLGGVLCHDAQAADEAPNLRFTRVKGVGNEMRQLIREADARSPTVRALVDEIGRSNAIVLVEFGFCHGGRVRSCVMHVAGDQRQRHIRVMVSTRTTNDRLLATIAHELQHAVEIVREPDVTDAKRALALYRRIGTRDCQNGTTDACETDAALAIERTVLDELDRAPLRP